MLHQEVGEQRRVGRAVCEAGGVITANGTDLNGHCVWHSSVGRRCGRRISSKGDSMKKAAVFIVMAFLVLPGLVFAGGQSATVTAQAADYSETAYLNLTHGMGYNTDTFNHPWFIQQTDSYLFQSLLKYDTYTDEFIPYLAESFSVSDDKLTYKVVIGDETYWHDGEKVTAEDVKWSFDGLARLSNYTQLLRVIEGAEEVIAKTADSISGITVDGNVVTFKLKRVDTTFLYTLANNLMSILPEHAFEGVALEDFFTYLPFLERPIGSGPYMVDEMRLPDYVTLVRFDQYNQKPAGVKHIMKRTYTAAEASLAAIVAGDIDFIDPNAINEENIQMMARNPNLEFHYVESLYHRFLMANISGATDGSTTGDMAKPEVRQALNLLLDKETIAEIRGGGAVPLTTMLNPGSSYYNTDIPQFERNVAKAVEMLKAANFDFSQTIRLATAYNDQVAVDILEYVKQNLADAGINATYSIHTTNVADVLWISRPWELWYGANNSTLEVDPYRPFGVPFVFDRVMLGTEEYRRGRYNTLIDQYTATLSPTERKTVVDELQVRGVADTFFLPLYSLNTVRVINAARVEGIPILSPGQEFTGYRRWDEWRMISD